MELKGNQVFIELIQEFQQQFLCYRDIASKRFQELEELIGVAAEKMEVLQKRRAAKKKREMFVKSFCQRREPDRKSNKEPLHHLRLKLPKFVKTS